MTNELDLFILNLKLILYHRSKVNVFGVPQQEKERMTNMLNCNLGGWPMKYLRIPISDERLVVSVFQVYKRQNEEKIRPWKSKHLRQGGKLILTNSCLTSLSMYTMGFYLLPSIRGKFFWQGAKDEFKHHMAKMKMICRPKEQGGLGIINTHIMNDCLLVKWICKIVRGSNDTWYKLLQAKYMPDDNFFNSKSRETSQFWQGLHKVKHLFKWGLGIK